MWRWVTSGAFSAGPTNCRGWRGCTIDRALSQVLGVEAIASQSTLSRFFDVFGQKTCNALNGLHRQAAGSLPSLKEGYTLDLDSWSLLHEDGHQQRVAVGHTPVGAQTVSSTAAGGVGRKQIHRQLLAAPGRQSCANGAAEVLRQTRRIEPGGAKSSIN